MALPQFTGTLGKKNAAHLLRRAVMVYTKTDVDLFSGLDSTEALNTLFQPVPTPEPPINPGLGTTWVDLPSIDGEDDGSQQNYFKYWWLGLMMGQGLEDASLKLPFLMRERIVYFLHTHFTTIQDVVASSRALYFQNVLFRYFALDGVVDETLNFKELSKKICLDSAMLILLDGRLNVKGRPNENFAREFLELYTIGKGLPGQIPQPTGPGDYIYFTEQDVQAASKVFSGYQFDKDFLNPDPDTGIPRVIPKQNNSGIANQHDNDVKEFSFRFGNATITPDPTLMVGDDPTEASMLDEIDQLVELVFNQEETAKNICRKLYRFFVYHEVTETVENTIIAGMVATFKANNYKMEPVIKELLGSQHFFDSVNAQITDDNYGGLIKSPLDLVLGTIGFLEYQLPDLYTESALFYEKADTITSAMSDQGMNFLNPYDVAGYEAYFQFPLFNRNWISANSLTSRYKFIFDTLNTINEEPEAIQIDLLDYIKLRFNSVSGDPDTLIREIVSYIFPMYEEGTEITTERLNYFKSVFYQLGTGLSQGPLAFWNYSYANSGSNQASREDARGMLQDLFNAMMQSPEYQLF